MKKTLSVSVLLISLMLITTQIAYGGSNPPPELPPGYEYGQYMGPDITGTITVQLIMSGDTPYGTSLAFYGSCKKNLVEPDPSIIVDSGVLFDKATPEYLIGTCGGCKGPQQLLFTFPDDCFPKNKYVNPYPFVYKVIHFIDNGNTKIFDIVGRWLVIIPPNP
jgi:hypothetical protein